MGFSGDRLAPMFSPEPARQAARRMARVGRDELLASVVRNTAVDDSPFPSRKPGTARRSWKTKLIVGPVHTSASEEVYETGVETEDKVAVYLEYGTGLYGPEHHEYKIRPKNPNGYLRFYSRKNGKWVFAREVTHPGIHPQRPLATAVALTEHKLPEFCQPILERWKREQELAARAQARR